MKQLFFTVFLFAGISAKAQTTPAVDSAKTAPKIELTKEQKALLKAKQEKDLNDALTGAGLNADEVAKAKEIITEASKKSSELKGNTKLADAEKEAAKKAITDDKNAKLKALMGADRYSTYNDIRKKQKEQAALTPQPGN